MEKPRKIKESLFEKFSEESDPVKDMGVGKLGMFKALEKRGVTMRFNWGDFIKGKSEGQWEKEKVIENIYEITELVNKLEKVGFDVKQMEIRRSEQIYVTAITILRGNWTLFPCPTEEDAQLLIKLIKMFSIWDYDTFETTKSSIGESIPVNPKYHKWLDNFIENREKIKKVLNV